VITTAQRTTSGDAKKTILFQNLFLAETPSTNSNNNFQLVPTTNWVVQAQQDFVLTRTTTFLNPLSINRPLKVMARRHLLPTN
jgi:hypothetical protein